MKNIFLLLLCLVVITAKAQYKIKPKEGYTPQIGILVDMLEEIKDRISKDVEDLNQDEVDFLIDAKANSIGAIIMHLAATEVYYQVETLEERTMTMEEEEFWATGLSLTNVSRTQLKKKPVNYYLGLWDEVRDKTLQGLKKRDDAWLAAEIDETMNNHWAWFHILEHQASHMGQISLIKNRFPQ